MAPPALVIDLVEQPIANGSETLTTPTKVRKANKKPVNESLNNSTEITTDGNSDLEAVTKPRKKKTGRRPKIKDAANTESIDESINATILSIVGSQEEGEQEQEVDGLAVQPVDEPQEQVGVDDAIPADMSTIDDSTRKKKRQYKRRKIQSIEPDSTTTDQMATVGPNDEPAVDTALQPTVDDDNQPPPYALYSQSNMPYVPKQRRKTSQHFAKLLKKKQKKKRKLSSDDDDQGDDDDDSDEYELPAAINASLLKKSHTTTTTTTQEFSGDTQSTTMTTSDHQIDSDSLLQMASDKRRSARANVSKKRKYIDDNNFRMDDDEDEATAPGLGPTDSAQDANPAFVFASSDTFIVEKLLGMRQGKRKLLKPKPVEQQSKKHVVSDDSKAECQSIIDDLIGCIETNTAYKYELASDKPIDGKDDDVNEDDDDDDDGEEIEIEEFFVKFKSLSYLHCAWLSRDELFANDKRIDQKIKRFKIKKAQEQPHWDADGNRDDDYEEELFNPDYVEVDRILDAYDIPDPNGEPNAGQPQQMLSYYLVKWKVLPYEEATWELKQDVDKCKIEQYERFNRISQDLMTANKHVQRPKADKWTKLNKSRTYKNGNWIRDYQLEGINWLSFCWLNGRNCILADEMGLGKTIQSITFLQEVFNYGIRGPFLIIVPLSTIGNWNREFETWTDFNVIVYHGSSTSRQLIKDYEFFYNNDKDGHAAGKPVATTSNNKQITKFNALITTFEVLLSDVAVFCQFKWRNVIIDEAHRLKNKNCKLIEGLRYIDCEHKVLLTGTPLQNNVEELFSLLNFLEPQQFHSSQEFMQEFGDLKTDTQVTKLQAVLKPMMLRRLKEDVEKSLAPKEETIIEVELTNTQKKYYRAILEKNFQFLSRGSTSSSNVPNLMNTMMELRKCCNHPYLTTG